MPRKRTIAIVTGSRADFGILMPVIDAVRAHKALRLRLIVTGTHLSLGTWRDVARSVGIDAKVRMQTKADIGRSADVAALGRGITGLGRAVTSLRPHVVLVLGDRVEALAAGCAASVGGFHLAHVHGGDRAEGVADEAIRHAVSKLAHLHFAACRSSAERLKRMGEHDDTVFNVGSPAIDGLAAVEPADDALLKKHGLDPARPYVVVMQHPIGESDAQEKAWMAATLAATRSRQRIVMTPNGDPGTRGITAAIRAARVTPVTHLPRGQFLRLLKRAEALAGNSSAGLIEAAALRADGVPVVNVGPRQAGRDKPANVIDCGYGEASVREALRQAVNTHRASARHPFGDGRAGERIAETLATLDLKSIPLRKRNAY